MKLKCKACGNTERFLGWQSVEADGPAPVFVDGQGEYQGDVDQSHDYLEWHRPEGPWKCSECDSEDIEENKLESTVFPDRANVRIDKFMVNEGEGIVVVNGVRYHVEPVCMAILDCLANARGGWVSCAEMQAKKPILRDENRIDRVIKRFKADHWRLRNIIESVPGRGYRIRTP